MALAQAPRALEGLPGITLLDSGMFGEPEFGGVYLLEDRSRGERALVETGTSHTVQGVLAALQGLGIDPGSIRYLLVTHIHLDHAGGAGFLLDHLPRATVVVHERGARHLADPRRLLESAAMALGEAAPSYGTLKPIPPDRMVPVRGGEVIPVGDREVEVVYTPGHARHHVCYLDRATNALFTGDAAGIVFPRDGRLLPTTPYPEFDLTVALGTMDAIRALHPSRLLLTHFGPLGDVDATLAALQEEYRRWDERVRGAEALDIPALTRAIFDEWYRGTRSHPRRFVERIIETNIRGFRSYYGRAAGGP